MNQFPLEIEGMSFMTGVVNVAIFTLAVLSGPQSALEDSGTIKTNRLFKITARFLINAPSIKRVCTTIYFE
ncbi:MAG: hypothetical protein ACRCXZ_00805 [Patescibacteria group bacterium]